MVRARSIVAGAMATLLSSRGATGWGHEGHYLVNRLALEMLPAGGIRTVLDEDRRQVIVAGGEPDNVFRSAYHEVEPERHFFHLDGVAPPPYRDVPRTFEAIAACARSSPGEVGRLPLSVAESYQDLVDQLRRGDRLAARRVAGILGHYVADATMPFHATRNHDGWDTGNDGIHRLLEVTFYRWDEERIARDAKELARHPDSVAPPAEEAILLLREAIGLVPKMLAADGNAKRIGGPLDGRDGKALKAVEPDLARQIARAARALAGLWLRAAEEAHASSASSR